MLSLTAKQYKIAGYASLFIIQLVTACILVAGVQTQGVYGPSNVCLFYISNYHIENASYVFSARSSECANLVALGSFGIVLTLFSGTLFLYYLITDKNRPSNVSLLMAVLATLFSIFAIVGAATASAGLSQTCNEFERLTGGACSSVFSTGFLHDGDISFTYVRDLGTLYATVNACWFLFVSWLTYAGLEWYNYKSENSKWW